MHSVKILVLEDDLDMREALEEVLIDEGYSVVAVGRGQEAVEQASREAFDLIVSDVRMEGMSGLDTIEEVKKQHPDMGSLVVSGWASEEETLRAVRLNVGGYLKKPFPMQEFLETVRQLLERRAQQQQRGQHSDSLQRALDWGISTLTRVADQSALLGPQGSLDLAGRLAHRLGRHLGLSEEVSQQVRWLTLFAGLQELPGVELPQWLRQEAHQLTWVAALEEPTSPLWEIANLAREVYRASDEALPTAAQLAEKFPNQFSPRLLQALEAAAAQPPVNESGASPEVMQGLQDPSRIDRSLLGLARTLEEAGDLASAQKAYQQVLERSPLSREGVQALLGSAHLAMSRANLREAVELAQRVPAAAAQLGPVTLASALLECGLIHYRAGAESARVTLEQAASGLARIGMRFGQAQACLLLSRLGSESARGWLNNALPALQDPVHSADFAAAAPWMVVELVELAADPHCASQAPAILQAALGAPRQLTQLLQRNQLSPASRLRLAEGLGQTERFISPEIVEALSQDEQSQVREMATALRQRSRPAEGAAPAPVLRLQGFGFFEVVVGEQKVPEAAWKTQKTKYLLAYLASQVGKLVAEEQILEEFWPDNLARGKRNLYAAISIVRRLTRPVQGDLGGDFGYVVRDRDLLGFNWELPHWYDVELLEAAAARANRSGVPLEEITLHLRRVAQLYSGPYLDGVYFDWVLRRREELENLVLGCLNRLAFGLCQMRQYQEALEHSTRAVAMAPHSQEAHLMKMRSHLGLNQPEAVVRQFTACERILKQEYDVEPNTELMEVCLRARHGLPDAAQ